MNRALLTALVSLVGVSVSPLARSQPLLDRKTKVKVEKIGTVRYSYEKWSRAGRARYVLVPEKAAVEPGTLQDRIRALFALLRAAKRNSYGDTRIAFQPDAATTGEVWVYLDAAVGDYHAIVMAETVFTFTENGASRVMFRNSTRGDVGWTRADVPFPAYQMTLPLWEVLTPTLYTSTLAQMPDGTILPQGTVDERLRKVDPAIIDAMWSYVETGPAPASQAAIKSAIHLQLADLADRLMPILQSANGDLRRSALEGLATFDTESVNAAVRKVMDSDPDPALRDVASTQLAKSSDKQYSTAAQYHALRSSDPKVVAAAAIALGESKQAEAGKQLIEILQHDAVEVRAAAIASLQKRGDHDPLTTRLIDLETPEPRRLEIARALVAGEHADSKLKALRFLAVEGKGDDAASAAGALAAHTDAKSLEALGKALAHAEAATRIAAAAAFGKIGTPDTLPILGHADGDDAESGDSVMATIRGIYGRQNLDSVLEGTRESNGQLRRAAVATLGQIVKRDGKKSKKKVVDALRTLAKDRDPLIRASAATSFGVLAEEEFRADIMALAIDEAVEVQRAVALALEPYPSDETTTQLLKYIDADDPQVIAHAARTLGQMKAEPALNPVLNRLEHDDVRVRRAATGALVAIGGTLDKRGPLLSFFSDRLFDDDPEVKMVALRGLVLVNDARVVTAMAATLQDPDLRVRQATLMAMAETGDAGAVEPIASALEDDDLALRRTALAAFRMLKRKEALGVLGEYATRETDKALAEEASEVIKALKGG